MRTFRQKAAGSLQTPDTDTCFLPVQVFFSIFVCLTTSAVHDMCFLERGMAATVTQNKSN